MAASVLKGTVSSVEFIAEGIIGIKIKLEGAFSFVNGQYAMISFLDRPDVKKSYSIVSFDSSSNELYFGILVKGDFTTRLSKALPGEVVEVRGPYGRFVLPEAAKPLIFIAGGIGVTPLYSMLQQVRDSNYSEKLRFYYSAKSRAKTAFLKELEAVKDERIVKTFLFDEDGGDRLTALRIKNEVPDFFSSLVYICGPKPMMDALKTQLVECGFKEEDIRTEEFI